MRILADPQVITISLWISIYIIAIILGFLLILVYKNQNFALILNKMGFDLYGPEGVWYRLLHHSDFITVYLKDGNIIAGWPTYYSQTGEKNYTELYLTKVSYFQENKWTKPHESVDGILINTDSIQRIEFRKSKTRYKSIEINKNKKVIKDKNDDSSKSKYNPVSIGTLYFGFASSLWSSEQIKNNQIFGIAIFVSVITFIFFLAIYSSWIYELTVKVKKYLTGLTFIAFIFGFLIGWLKDIKGLSGMILALVIYFGFVWFVTILLVEIKEIRSKVVRIGSVLFTVLILLGVSLSRFFHQDYWAGGYLLVISIFMVLVATNVLKLHGSVFE